MAALPSARAWFPAILALAVLFHPGAAIAGKSLSITAGLIPWKGIGGPGNLSLRECYEEFLRNHPGLELVEYRSARLPGVYRGAAEVMSLAATAGPDVTLVPFSMLANFVREGLIQPVDDLYGSWPEKNRWPDTVVKDLMVEGHHWGSVLSPTYAMLIGSPMIFKDQGLSDDDMPATWEEFAKLIPRLSRPGKNCGLALYRGNTLGYLWLALAREAGADPVKMTGDGIEVDLESEGSRRAVEFIGKIGRLAMSSPSSSVVVYDRIEDLTAACGANKVAMVISNDFSKVMLGSDAYMSPLPGAFTSEPLAYADGGSIFLMPSYIHDPYIRSSIWNFQTTEVWNGRKVDMLEMDMAIKQESRDLRPILAVWYPDHPAAALVPVKYRQALAKVWSRARPMPPDLEFEELAGIMSARLIELFTRGGDPSAVLKDARLAFDSKVHQWERRKMTKWRVIGWGVLGIFAGLLVFSLVRLGNTLKNEIGAYRLTPSSALSANSMGFSVALFAPALILSVVFGVVPLLQGLKMSFSSHVLREGGQFVGLANYFDVITNPLTLMVLSNTMYYLAVSFVLGFAAPLLLALVLADFPWKKSLLRSAFFLPSVCSAVVLAVLWQQVYKGPFNVFANLLGFSSREWLKDPGAVMFAVVLPSAWANLGVSGLVYFAGLASIPESLYEDTEISGGGLWDRIRAVTIPHLAPLIGVSFVGWIISAVRTAENVFLLTGGGPEKATHVVGIDIFTQAYVSIRFGYAMAEVWLLVALILMLSIYQVRAIRSGNTLLGRD